MVIGDARHLPYSDGAAQCCVTSPPYYGLRDYGHAGQIGLEQTPAAYVAEIVEAMREVWRVLRDDGVLWLNLGDSYNGQASDRTGQNGFNDGRTNRDKRYSVGGVANLKPKNLIGIPWRVAFALQDDGWYLRSDIIWAKPNPMPESVTDRPTKAHEYVFLLAKQPRYYYDAEAIKEEASESTGGRQIAAKRGTFDYQDSQFKDTADVGNGARNGGIYTSPYTGTRNVRSVWQIATQPYSGAHFATMPPELAKRCILAGSRPGDMVLDPFSGSGTTGKVAIELGRRFIGTELNEKYIRLQERRMTTTMGMMI